MPNKIRVLLCDDHPMLRTSVREVLASVAKLEIIGDVGCGMEAVDMALKHTPDVVVMDLELPDLDGIEATRRIVSEAPGIKVLIYSALQATLAEVRRMLLAGASGYLVKGGDADELILAVKTVGEGGLYLNEEFRSLLPGFLTLPCRMAPTVDKSPGG